jgi:hypothetical protein
MKYFPGDLSVSDENERNDEEAAEETGSDDDSGNEYYSGNSSDEGGDYYEDGDSNFAFEFEEDKFLNEDIAEHIQEMAGDEDEAGFITIPQLNYNVPWKTTEDQDDQPLKRFIRQSDGQMFPFDGQVRKHL